MTNPSKQEKILQDDHELNQMVNFIKSEKTITQSIKNKIIKILSE
jgi:hypothetical protein